MLSLSRTARTLRGAQCARRFSAEIPIKTVCRVVSCDVKDEATAVKMDALLAEWKAVLDTVPGVTGLERRVCKSEWDYATTTYFADIDALKSYLGDAATQAKADAIVDKASALVGGEMKRQNFVYDKM
mmetsp:Transcript_3743/g.11079  ORF Transcript_3743/g.11079 Transcript_3743/m.11079 type:complete len:128 (-) Transcript_3743:151-534(-)